MDNKQSKKTTSTELTEKQIAMLKSATKYTENDIQEWHTEFIYNCPNGRLDKKNFTDIYEKFYPNGKVDRYCEYAFNTFDRNNDGTIDFEEFLLSMAATSQGSIDDRLGFVFDMYDTSRDGLIDQKQLTSLISAMFDLLGTSACRVDCDPETLAENIMAYLDVNGDKKLDKKEFIAGCKNNDSICRLLAPNI
ncbi:unnamed protein product [Rotaria sp. Silwood1]|nr:unnamed protein product [Rotaria sp. Silwood1]CAF1310596.1 unnamed protein product [Rotaria sp. Silwood1]CAF1634262.1 unnamed protein product [Rotaria sp. Silwood1]CAF1634323.1 unnamed protein product [Rotaria sp. Silwood1]CAF3781193.1 unnamed protein product [Rotaria sp. Silwood1]